MSTFFTQFGFYEIMEDNVKVISIMECKSGDILAEDVFSCNGIVLVAKFTIVNDFIKRKLHNFNVNSVKIYESKDNLNGYSVFVQHYKEYVFLIGEVLKGIAAGDCKEVEKLTTYITEQIYQNRLESEYIVQFLHNINEFDNYTYTHCINTAFYSMLIGTWIHLSQEEIYELISASLMHDVGKTKIPNHLLNKNGKLNSDEYDILKNHSLYSYEIIKDIPTFSQEIKNAVLMHHERMDGSGYPYGLKEDDICLYAKIISIADVFDAMTQNRVYKSKVSPFDSFKMFLSEGISLFCYPILNVFLKRMAPLYIGANVKLSDGNTGEIVYIPPQDILKPILNINSKYVDLSKCSDIKVLQIV